MREVKEETGLHVRIVRKIGEYHESGIQDGVKYNYCPACFLVKPTGGKIRRQEKEIEEIRVIDPRDAPEKLAFERSTMIRDYISMLKEK